MARLPKLVESIVSSDTAFNTEVDAIALVDFPAIEVDFKVLSSQKKHTLNTEDVDFEDKFIQHLIETAQLEFAPNEDVMTHNADQNLLFAPIMLADKPIYRIGFDWDKLDEIWDDIVDLPGDEFENKIMELYYEYHMIFPPSSVEFSARNYISEGYAKNTNLMHDRDIKAKGVNLVESWTVSDPLNDKSNGFGFAFNRGSWVGLFQVNNPALKSQFIDTGELRGVSVEVWAEDNVLSTQSNETKPLQRKLSTLTQKEADRFTTALTNAKTQFKNQRK